MPHAHRFVEHVGELELELEADTAAGLFAAAFEAFASLLDEGHDPEPAAHRIELENEDRALLLVDWLGELVFLAETERFLPQRLDELEVAEGRLQAAVAGHRGSPRQLVKAVTLNDLALEQRNGRWHARVVLDV